MNKILTLIFCVITYTMFGQETKKKTFIKSDYPTNKYFIKTDTFRFHGLVVTLIQAKLREYKTLDNTSPFCRIWLTVTKGRKKIDELYFNDCEAVGGCSGVYFSKKERRKDHLLFSKYGDYDGRILIVDSIGKIRSFVGGYYYLSIDNKYLFSPYDSDLSGLTIYDLTKNKVLLSSDSIQNRLGDFYFYRNNYFAVISSDVKVSKKTKIVTFDFKTNKLVTSLVSDDYIKNARKLQSHNEFDIGPCGCGQTKE